MLVGRLPSKSSTEIELQADKKTTIANTFITTLTMEGSFWFKVGWSDLGSKLIALCFFIWDFHTILLLDDFNK